MTIDRLADGGQCLILLLSVLLFGCGRTPEASLARYLREGQELAAKKDYPRAILQFKNASQSMPQHPEPYYQLALAAIAMGDTQSAAESLKQTMALDPKRLDALIALADLCVRSAHTSAIEEGKRIAQRALAIEPENVKALNMAALADLRTGRAKEAAAQLLEMSRRFPNDIESSINLARALLTLGDRRGAERVLESAAANSPQDVKAVLARADYYNITGNLPKATDWYSRGLQLQPDNAQALMALGRLHAKTGRHQEADAIFSRLAQNPDRRFRYAYAMRLFDSGRRDAAIMEFERIFMQNPEDRQARTHLVDAYLGSGRMSEAEKLLNKALRTDSGDVDALAQRARVHLLRGSPEDAEKDLNIARGRRGQSAELHYLTAQIHRSRQNEQLQLRELSEALRLDPGYSAARIELSRCLISKDPRRALTVLESAPEGQRQNPELRVQRIWPLIELKRFEEARRAIDALLSSGNSEVLLQDAALRMLQKDFAAARESAQSALSTNPADVRALELILRCSVGEKKPAEGLEAVRRHASEQRRLAAVQMFLGRVELQAGNAGQARIAFETAKQAEPGALAAEWSLIELDIAERKFEDARRRIAPLLQGSSATTATAKLALLEQTAGNYEAATQHYREVLQAKPSNAGILNSLAYILAEFLGKPTEALPYAQTAKQLAPENAAVDDTLGWTYYQMGSYDDAVRHLELAVNRAPSARRQAHLAMAYARNGEMARAKRMLTVAIEMDPNLPEASLAKNVVAESAPGASAH
jgi:tetratricopeptide (TPR) repeat protein